MDIDGLVARFLTGVYTVTRRAKATFVNGVATSGATSTLSIQASVQPASGRDLMRLPEGRRTNETRVVFTTTELKVGGQGSDNEADLVTVDGASWEVQAVETWRPAPFMPKAYFRCTIQAAT